MKNTKIEWCDHTFNPWIGCTKVSPGCANCYAEAQDRRWGNDSFGPGKARRMTSAAYWGQPLKWDAEAKKDQELWEVEGGTWHRPRVFCASLADWLDDEVPIEWLVDLLSLIQATPNLDWLLLTKRPENFRKRIGDWCEHSASCDVQKFAYDWLRGSYPANVWLGTTVENQEMADKRIPELLKIPAKVRFLSCEPLLGTVNLDIGAPKWRTADSYHAEIHWVICGGESGPHARPMHPDWARSLRDQCKSAGVPFFFKQWGEWAHMHTPSDADEVVGCFNTWPNGKWLDVDGGNKHRSWDTAMMDRIGKKASGCLLDGVEHKEFPGGAS